MGLVELWVRSTRARYIAVASLLAGCSVITDSSVVQCQRDGDCAKRFGDGLAVACIDNFCVPPACSSDADCRARGAQYASAVCSSGGVCMATSAASAPDAGGGLDAGLPADEMATSTAPVDAGAMAMVDAGQACVTVSDCKSLSPTVACNGGVCEDPTWGCVGELDERPPAVQPTATLRGTVVDGTTRMPVLGMTASACLLPTFDPECARPFPSATSSYDLDAGVFTLQGVPQDTQVRVKIEFPADAGLLPLDQYTARTAHDLTMLPTLITLPFAVSSSLTTSLDPPRVRDPANASITASVLDCQNEPAVGVQIRIAESDRINGTEVFYFAPDGQINQKATATDAFGVALVINVKPGKLITLQTWAGNLMLNEFHVLGFPHRSTAVSFFPRIYPDRTAPGG